MQHQKSLQELQEEFPYKRHYGEEAQGARLQHQKLKLGD
jgi:hypothetical protein